MALVVCDTDGVELYRVGGRWDHKTKRYVGEARTGRVIRLRPSQVEAGRWFAQWLEDKRAGRERDHALMLGGARRGGKSFLSVLLLVSLCLETPGAITWIVSPTIELREEIERWFTGEPDGRWKGLPEAWYTYRATPQFKYYLANGSTCRNVSGAVPSRMKRGKSHGFVINEAQEQADSVATYSVPSVIDTGGLGMFAANPPDKVKGQWVNGFREKLKGTDEDGQPLLGTIDGRYWWVNPALNDTIDQGLRGSVGRTLYAINETAAKRDAEGQWLSVGDRAYPKFDARRHLREIPDVGDITADVLRKKGRAFPSVAGADFQGVPHQVAVVCKVFANPGGSGPIYAFTDECVVDEATEDDLIDEIESRGYAPETLKVIGDASGAWQDGAHKSRGRGSHDVFRARRYHIEGPRKKMSAQGQHAKNPAIEDRLSLVMRLMSEDRILVDPVRCPRLAEAFKECPLVSVNGRRKPRGRFSHITDAAGYVLFWLEPPPKAQRTTPSDPRKWLASGPLRSSPI